MIALILDNIRSSHNVGSIFRTADGAGVFKIYLVGYTPAPVDQFGRANKDIAKTALGGEKSVEWEKADNILELIEKLKTDGLQIVALEQSPKSVDYRQVQISNKVAIILGNEVGGIEQEVLGRCDIIAEIEMRGEKESLNVSVACGVALFRWLE